MKIVTAENGKKTVKISRKEWRSIGKKAGWMKIAITGETPEQAAKRISEIPPPMNFGAANDIINAADGDRESLQMLHEYYPAWTIIDFKRCVEILESMGIN